MTGDPYNNCYSIIHTGNFSQIIDELYSLIIINHTSIHLEPKKDFECGQNTIIRNDRCECISNYVGDPNKYCYPECISNSDCPNSKFCKNNICVVACLNACAENAICEVKNYHEFCSCPPEMYGDPVILCKRRPVLGTFFSKIYHIYVFILYFYLKLLYVKTKIILLSSFLNKNIYLKKTLNLKLLR